MNVEKLEHNYNNEIRIVMLENTVNNINDTLLRFEKRFDKIDSRFDKMDDKFTKIEDKMSSNFRWLLTVMGSGFVLLLGAIHWL